MSTEAFQGLVESLSNEFDAYCQKRHDFGEQKYGPVRFAEVDTLEMAIEEVIDLANYARYTFVKLRLVQEHLKASLEEPPALGSSAFIPVGKQDKE